MNRGVHSNAKKKQLKVNSGKVSKTNSKAKIKKISKPVPKKKVDSNNVSSIKYLKTNVPGFDKLIHEGIPEGNAILIEGGPGSGKTIFCLEIVKRACMQGKKVLFMSFEEPEERLRMHMKSFGSDAEKFEKQGILNIKRFNALDISRSVEALLSEAKKELLIEVQPVLIPEGFDPDIVIIDSLSSIASSFSGEENRFRIYMEQLFRYLEKHKMTSFLIREVSNPTHTGNSFVERGEAVSFLSDGIISIYNVFYKGGRRKRAIEVIKMRGSGIDTRIVEYEIQKGKGATCYPNKVLKGDFVLT